MAEGVKHDSGKLRMDLIPAYPLMRLAEVYTIGAKKYDDDNWRKGMGWKRIFAAMVRHSWKWFVGERFDPVDGQHHLSSVAWCAFTLMEYEITHPELDDRPKNVATHLDMAVPASVPDATGDSTPVKPESKWISKECADAVLRNGNWSR